MRDSLLISLAIAGLVLFSVTLSVVVTAEAVSAAPQMEAPVSELGMFRVGKIYTTYTTVGGSGGFCTMKVLEVRGTWALVKKAGRGKCMLRWIVNLNTPKTRFHDGRGVWINTAHLLSVIEW